MVLKRQLIIPTVLLGFFNTQASASFLFSWLESKPTQATSTSASATSVAAPSAVEDFLNDFSGDKESVALVSAVWGNISSVAAATTSFLANKATTLFESSQLSSEKEFIFKQLFKTTADEQKLSEIEKYRGLTFQSTLREMDKDVALQKIAVGKSLKEMIKAQTDLLNDSYIKPLTTKKVDDDADLTASLVKTVNSKDLPLNEQVALEKRKLIALENFNTLLNHAENSVMTNREMFLHLINEAMIVKKKLPSDLNLWTNFNYEDLAMPFIFQMEDTLKSRLILPVVLAQEGLPKKPEKFKYQITSPEDSATATASPTKAPKSSIKEVEFEGALVPVMIETEDEQGKVTVVHRYMGAFLTDKKPLSLGWRLLGYK